ncbi:MAG: flagellar hook-associated protein FlgK [Clostridiales bacterium]|nr:flagellar hook-associated protein FlgK [Clostridiales bacterium]
MRATFFGFESVRKALMASQKGLDVTIQNVSNVNTEGYTRQRVDISSISPESGATRYAKTKGEAVGGGVEVTGITQIRDQFLDLRFRKEAAEYGKWSASFSIMTDIENVLDEVSTNGLSARLNDLYKELESFSINAESIEFASIFRSSAQKVVEVLNQYSLSLADLQDQYLYNIRTDIDSANRIIQDIAQLNSQIRGEVLQGSPANELCDMRNLLIDRLSGYIGVGYEFDKDGQVSLKLGDTYLLDASKNNKIETIDLDASGYPVKVVYKNGKVAQITAGSIGGSLSGLNGKGSFAMSDSDDKSIGIKYFQMNIDSLARSIAESFNSINDPSGVNKLFDTLDGSPDINASNIKISDEWMRDARFIKRSTTESGEGSNDNLLRMITCLNEKRDITPNFKGTFEEFVVSLMGDVAVQTRYSKDMKDTSESILSTISDQRESIMGVSIDEESINMERYQKSYNAAARIMTVLDEMLDMLINHMGIVGR